MSPACSCFLVRRVRYYEHQFLFQLLVRGGCVPVCGCSAVSCWVLTGEVEDGTDMDDGISLDPGYTWVREILFSPNLCLADTI